MRGNAERAIAMLADGMSREDIADALNISDDALRMLLARARKAGASVPYAKRGRPSDPETALRMHEVYTRLTAAGQKHGAYDALAERFQTTRNAAKQRVLRVKWAKGDCLSTED